MFWGVVAAVRSTPLRMRRLVVQCVLVILIHHGIAILFSNDRFGPYFAEPVIAGLDPETNEPFITGMDLLGAMAPSSDFIVRAHTEISPTLVVNKRLRHSSAFYRYPRPQYISDSPRNP